MKEEKVSDKILNKIRKMLAMSKGQANEHEAAVAAAMAEKWMRKYGLEHEDVLIQEIKQDGAVDETYGVSYAKVPSWMNSLSVYVGRLFETEVRFTSEFVFIENRHQKRKFFKFYGTAVDVQVSIWTFTFLIEEFERLAEKHLKEYRESHPDIKVHGRRIKESFKYGAMKAVADKVTEIVDVRNKERMEASTSTALVVVKKQLIEEKYGKFSYETGGTNSDLWYDSYRSGMDAGKKINLNSPVENGKTSRTAIQ